MFASKRLVLSALLFAALVVLVIACATPTAAGAGG